MLIIAYNQYCKVIYGVCIVTIANTSVVNCCSTVDCYNAKASMLYTLHACMQLYIFRMRCTAIEVHNVELHYWPCGDISYRKMLK